MRKTHFIISLFYISFFSLAAGAENQKPNIIFIMADDLGYGDLGSYGQKEIKTPVLDQMAREGMLFSDCYAGSPVCAPSRSVLMTGLHTGHTRVRGNTSKVAGVRGIGGAKGRRVSLEKDDLTVAEVLKKAGYVTGMTGKWGLGEPGTDGLPNDKGFDHWFGYLNQHRAHCYYPEWIWKDRRKYQLPGNYNNKAEQYSHDLFEDFALDFVRSNADKPFFLYLPYLIPHNEYKIPELGQYADKPWKNDEKVHAAMISRMDKGIGELFSLLKELKIDGNTIVFFCSDNGAARRWEGRFDSSGILKGRKRDLYEGGIRTPMIVRWPGKVAAGKVSHQPWWLADVLPTCKDLAGSKQKCEVDGISVLPTLLGEQQDLSNRIFYWEFHEGRFVQAARWKNWKAVRFTNKPMEIYNLKNDPQEEANIAASNPELLLTFEKILKESRTNSRGWPSPLDTK